MAKRKTKKVEKIIDLKPKPAKISDEHLQRVRAAIANIDRLTMDLGKLALQKNAMIKGVEGVQGNIEAIRKEFVEEYGTDNINIQDGTISYPEEATDLEENNEVNSPENGEVDKKD